MLFVVSSIIFLVFLFFLFFFIDQKNLIHEQPISVWNLEAEDTPLFDVDCILYVYVVVCNKRVTVLLRCSYRFTFTNDE